MDYMSTASRWQAILQRDEKADGSFYYGVVTTDVYCSPSCASRIPLRKNVRFFDTREDAESAGFRPCQRCSPDKQLATHDHKPAIIHACERIKTSSRAPSLSDLAAEAGLSRSYFLRLFKQHLGITPKQYAMEVLAARMRTTLQHSGSVTQAIYDSGYASSSRFYAQSAQMLGMEPWRYRDGGEGVHVRFAISQCYLGWVLVAATSKGVCAIEFADAPEALESNIMQRFPQAQLDPDDADFYCLVAQVIAYLDTPHGRLDIPLDIQGTVFQRQVWQALCQIPSGATASYAQVAQSLGKPAASRAVAQACASNKIAVAIPCHRVLRSDGGLGGYRWGIQRKRALLEREREMGQADKK